MSAKMEEWMQIGAVVSNCMILWEGEFGVKI